MPASLVAAASFAYLFLLFAIAWGADRLADRGRSVIATPYVYALSLGVFCTTWTFYGSVGRASTLGIGFLPVYLGPTLVMTLGYVVIAKILRIAKRQRSTSIADFIAARYGKSHLLGRAGRRHRRVRRDALHSASVEGGIDQLRPAGRHRSDGAGDRSARRRSWRTRRSTWPC